MLIAYDTPGQLGNQLWAYSNLLATGISCQTPVVIILQKIYYEQLDISQIMQARENDVFILNANDVTARIVRKMSGYVLKKPNSILAKLLSIKVASKGSK